MNQTTSNESKTFQNELKTYFWQIKKALTCSPKSKRAIISSLKEDARNYVEEHQEENMTIAQIIEKFGTPEEIALSFSTEDEIRLRKKERKKRIILIIFIVILVIALTLTIYLLSKAIQKNSYTITTSW